LHYNAEREYAVLWIDQGISDFYRALIPRSRNVADQAHRAHITAVRLGIETISNRQAWGIHDGEEIDFEYDSEVRTDGVYYWLDAYCPRLSQIRQELGLPFLREGFDRFHITIGNCKHLH